MKTAGKSFGGAAGYAAMLASCLALIAVVAQLAVGPFAPQPTVEDSIADLVVGVKDAIKRRAAGEDAAPPAAKPWDVDRTIVAGSIGVAGLAMILGVVALVRQEPRLPALLGFSLGAGTLFVVWLQWLALIALGVLLIASVFVALGGDGLSF